MLHGGHRTAHPARQRLQASTS